VKYVFSEIGLHLGWIEDHRAVGRSDWTDTPPPRVGPRQAARWTGAAWEIIPDSAWIEPAIAAAWKAADAFAQDGMDVNSRSSLLWLAMDPSCPAWRIGRIMDVQAWWSAIWQHYAVVKASIQAGVDTPFDPAVPGACPWTIWQIAASEP
jgi:hypothetical protein